MGECWAIEWAVFGRGEGEPGTQLLSSLVGVVGVGMLVSQPSCCGCVRWCQADRLHAPHRAMDTRGLLLLQARRGQPASCRDKGCVHIAERGLPCCA